MASKKIIKVFNDLSWLLIECKLIYYRDELFSDKLCKKLGLDDGTYDRLEAKYRRLAKLLKKPPSVYKMVEIDEQKPSTQLAIKRLQKIDFDIRKRRFTGCSIRNRLREYM